VSTSYIVNKKLNSTIGVCVCVSVGAYSQSSRHWWTVWVHWQVSDWSRSTLQWHPRKVLSLTLLFSLSSVEMHLPIISPLTINWLSADTDWYKKKLILLSYLSYLFRLRLLSEDSYLLEGLQSADKTKNAPKSKVTKRTHFYWKWKPLSCLFTFGNKNSYLPTV